MYPGLVRFFFQFWRDDSPVIPCSTLTPRGIPIVLSNDRPRHLLAVPLLTKRIFKLNEWNQASHHICSTFQMYPTACFRNYKRSTKGKEPQCHKCWEQWYLFFIHKKAIAKKKVVCHDHRKWIKLQFCLEKTETFFSNHETTRVTWSFVFFGWSIF